MSGQVYCIYDFETFSKANLKAKGATEYAKDPSTRVLSIAWRIGTKETLRRAPVQVWSPYLNSDFPGELYQAFVDEKTILVAHNAAFERAITNYVIQRYTSPSVIFEIPPSRFRCTAAQMAALALPRKLEDGCNALNLPVRKDMEGHRKMLKLSQPRKPTKNNPHDRHNKLEDLKRVMDYNKIDVEADTEIFLSTPPLSPEEQRVWELDQLINDRGFLCDRELVEKVLRLIAEEKRNLNIEIAKLTDNEVTSATQRDRVLSWLQDHGADLPNMQAKTLEDALSSGLIDDPKAKRVAEIRQATSKSSTAKYVAFTNRMGSDSRARDGLMYHGASTGRWAGRGIQPHNFPQGRGLGNPETAIEVIKTGDLEWIRAIYGDPMTLFSKVLRSVIMAPDAKNLFVGDYAGIELRVVFWIADHMAGLKAIELDEDLYVEMASKIYRVLKEKVTKEQRDIGKRAVLGCGFGMGWEKFAATCAQFGVPVTDEIAERAVKTYRELHAEVPKLWRKLEKAAIFAVQNPGKKVRVNHTAWYVRDNFLWCELPSGRKLPYYKPSVRYSTTSWGDKRPTLYFWSVHPKIKKWVNDKTWGGTLTENVVQATARDIMVHSMFLLEDCKFQTVLTVHDEILCEGILFEDMAPSLKNFEKVMSLRPPWAKNLPIKVESWNGSRYRK